MFKRKPKSKLQVRIAAHKDRISQWERQKKRGKKSKNSGLTPIQQMWLKHAKSAVRKLENELRAAG